MLQQTKLRKLSSASADPEQKPTLLLVDDDRTMRSMLQDMLENKGYRTLTASSGEECLEILASQHYMIDALILDREMKGISGLQVVAHMKTSPELSGIPVIMLTGSGGTEKIQEGIAAGVYYYLVKPVDGALLKTIISAALRETVQKKALVSELDRYGSAMQALQSCQIALKTLQEAEDVACFLASCFPKPELAVTGLMELLVNAVEHGNLGITYEEKCELLVQDKWRSEIERRLHMPENQHKYVHVVFQRKEGHCLAQITDQGMGFDWRRFWHINPARASAGNGRGITRTRLMAFERMSYNEVGNSVTVMASESRVNDKDYAW